MNQLPTLYKLTSTGALQEWTVFFGDGKYFTKFGQTGGKIQESEPVVCEPKNVGRANATTAEAQCGLEAQALWEKKLKKDYTLDPNVKAGQTSDLIEGGILPMLAHKFSDQGDKLKYPCYVQPKLDGHRCIAVVDCAGKCTLWSRTRKPILSMPHIVKAIEATGLKNMVLDGELYNHAYRDKFEELTSLIRPEYAKPGHEVVKYHIYDCADNHLPFSKRTAWLDAWQYEHFIYSGYDGPLHLVDTFSVENEDALMVEFENFLAVGYEGAIARNAAGLYANKRSTDLLKIKQFDDAEFKCVGVEEGKGKMAGHAVFVCLTETKTEFKAKMKGSHDDLVKFFEHPELVVGKLVTVKYQGLTGKNKVPRFPVALRIRENV